MTSDTLLSVRDLSVAFTSRRGAVTVVDRVSFDLSPRETLGLVGESGCGKSVTALSLLRLLDESAATTGAESIVSFRGENLVAASPRRLREIRGAAVGFVFQEPMTSLNPVRRIGRQIIEAIRAHESVGRAEARARARDLLARVELPDPDRALVAYPHELSGGMRQRALIAMAVACRPALLIADEPTTALDVTVQAQILDLLASIREETGMAMLLISHDLAVVSNVADRIAVMYAGQVVETGPTRAVFARPRHPYTEGLLACVPTIEGAGRGLAVIPGRVPDPSEWPPGCRFHPRCPYAWKRCADEPPPPRPAGEAHGARCWLLDEPERRTGAGYEARLGAGA